MIGYLKGNLKHLNASEKLILVGDSVNSQIGYLIHVPQSSLLTVAPEGRNVEVHVYTHVKEDQLTLFGFESLLQKLVFQMLLMASGIGPKVALSILGQLPIASLLYALVTQEVDTLESLSGIGKKTASRMILELKDKAQALLEQYPLSAQNVLSGSGVISNSAFKPAAAAPLKQDKKRRAASASASFFENEATENNLENSLQKLMDIRSGLQNLGFAPHLVATTLEKIKEQTSSLEKLTVADGIRLGLSLIGVERNREHESKSY